jgi:uncharacterized protein YjbJ (UPF0337 family)
MLLERSWFPQRACQNTQRCPPDPKRRTRSLMWAILHGLSRILLASGMPIARDVFLSTAIHHLRLVRQNDVSDETWIPEPPSLRRSLHDSYLEQYIDEAVTLHTTQINNEDMPMDKDRIKGSAAQAKGAVKEAAGKILGDKKLETEGKTHKAAGKVQNAIGGLKDVVRGK